MEESSSLVGPYRYPEVDEFGFLSFSSDSRKSSPTSEQSSRESANCFSGALDILERFSEYFPNDETAIIAVTTAELQKDSEILKKAFRKLPHIVVYGSDSGDAYSYGPQGWQRGQVMNGAAFGLKPAEAIPKDFKLSVEEYGALLDDDLMSLGQRTFDALAEEPVAMLFDETLSGQEGRPLSTVYEIRRTGSSEE